MWCLGPDLGVSWSRPRGFPQEEVHQQAPETPVSDARLVEPKYGSFQSQGASFTDMLSSCS